MLTCTELESAESVVLLLAGYCSVYFTAFGRCCKEHDEISHMICSANCRISAWRGNESWSAYLNTPVDE